MAIQHPLSPIYDARSRVLLLGSFPSPKSRAYGFYYAHPQNRFWQVLALVFQEPLPACPAEKTAFLLRHHLALWDVLARCDIRGASDSSIQNPVPNDFTPLLAAAPIQAVFTTGAKAHSLYEKHCYPQTKLHAQRLPSPSPANCATSLTQLTDAYRAILAYL